MSREIVINFFSFIKKILFSEFADKFKPGSLKNVVDLMFRVFEKTAHNFDFITDAYLNAYEGMIQKELKLIDIANDDSVLIIGCGSLPSTSIVIAKKTNAKNVSVDIDKSAVKAAIKIIKKMNLSDKVKVKLVKDINYQIDNFDLIFILYGVKKQKKIFRYIFENAKSDVKIIIRSYSDDFKNVFDFKNFKVLDHFIIAKKVRSDVFGPVFSFLLEKK
jgi:D-arabinose 1-dehydrogenase-like Zn-dependent alcohol dehydrogenase